MRKIFSLAMCGFLLTPALALAACGGGGEGGTAYTIRAEYFPE